MTFLDLHPYDPVDARFNLIATLVLLSELGVITSKGERTAKARASEPARSPAARRAAHGRTRLVRPPRSC